MKRSTVLAGMLVLLGLAFRVPAGATEAEATAAPAPYSGGLFTRSTLTGDWLGLRNEAAAKGITFDINLTQIEQGVVDGGKNGSWEYGGRGDLTGHLDTQKLGLWPGGFLTVELEGNFSNSVNGKTGALMPANSQQLYPLPTGDNVALPALNFAQFVSPYAGVIVGKVATITANSGDMNEFAHGKGDTQFFNLAFNLNPTLLYTVPYSTLGTGVIVLPTKDPHEAVVELLVMQATGSASTSGFDDLSSDNLTFAGSGRVRTNFFDLTGHQLVGATYSNRQFTQLDQRVDSIIENQALQTKRDSWCVYYNFDHFLYETDKAAGHGVGLFGRFGASDGDPNLMQYFYSAGVGGKGLIPTRTLDQFGVGYYYLDIQSPTFTRPLAGTRSFLRDEWGFEAYYNVAVTPWMLLTPDIQVIGPAQKRQLANRDSVDTGTVLGIRGQLIF